MRTSHRTLLVILLFLTINLGCAMSAGQPKGTPTPNIGTLAAQTVAAIVTNTPITKLTATQTATPQASPTAWPSATAANNATGSTAAAGTPAANATQHPLSEAEQTATVAAYTPITTAAMAQNVNMRQGPGTLFPVLDRLAKGTELRILAKARGDDWVYVDTGAKQGWVSVDFTTLQGRGTLAGVPIREVKAAVVVQGKVTDKDGKPVDGVVFAILQNAGSSNSPRTDAHTLKDGNFYAYLPGSTSGKWTVALTSFDCTSSFITSSDCKAPGTIDPASTVVNLPSKEVLEFKLVQ